MTSPIHPIDVILHKRDGLTLSGTEIQAFIRAIVNRTPDNQLVTDPQIAAFLMAVFQRGLNLQELAALTAAMRTSGDTFDASPLAPAFIVDKHSTGGVGDKLLSSSLPSSPPPASPRPPPPEAPESASP